MVLWHKQAPRSLKCWLVASDLYLNPYSGLSDMSVIEKALAQYPAPETGPSGPSWGKKEQTMSVDAPLVPKTIMSHNSGILASRGNLVSHVQAVNNGRI